MVQDAQIEELQTSRANFAREDQCILKLISSGVRAGNLDQDRVALGVRLDAEAVTPHERMVGQVRNLMVFNDFIEYIQECLAESLAIGWTRHDPY